jgi:hypothetical protein
LILKARPVLSSDVAELLNIKSALCKLFEIPFVLAGGCKSLGREWEEKTFHSSENIFNVSLIRLFEHEARNPVPTLEERILYERKNTSSCRLESEFFFKL